MTPVLVFLAVPLYTVVCMAVINWAARRLDRHTRA